MGWQGCHIVAAADINNFQRLPWYDSPTDNKINILT